MLKDVHIWLPDYIRDRLARKRPRGPVTILFAFVDHFEPMQKDDDPLDLQIERVETWVRGYEGLCEGHTDSAGRTPQHTYFFPQEQYTPRVLDILGAHCDRGFGETEIHIHHDNDTEEGFVEKIETFKEQLARHGMLPVDKHTGERMYGFIHGNWALDNARKDGRWCGLNNEITLLKKTGCYADFTLPCAPADGQTRKVNSIYFADDDPDRPRSHDYGRDIAFGGNDSGDLLLIQGPLMLNWKKRSRGFMPGIENGDVSLANRLSADRMKLWLDAGISVAGREEVIFIKVHTHGVKPKNTPYLLGNEMSETISMMEKEWRGKKGHSLLYVTAREMANVALAFNEGIDLPVAELFDYRLVLKNH
ncbi:MAG: hypothetical protein KAV42_06245 [Candidatus Krumholzibacteria bacterium]|nr:hypothetical protein [Candidatus Krumholzibacteria bacterium]